MDRAQSPRPIGSAYDAYNANLLSAPIAEYTGDQKPNPSPPAAQPQTAQCGLENRGDTRAKYREQGNPPSRAKANSIREFEVSEDKPQNHIAPITIQTRAPPSLSPN